MVVVDDDDLYVNIKYERIQKYRPNFPKKQVNCRQGGIAQG